ncbi:VOC family protein [Ornithinibacillus contaminans]|uniref:VOC family protein n=1 Tax=Ornithinibacillus contaminans TaxID=694055 RepID=UPI00069CC88C|nr:VOC family protein [Ornithinibacillus contaminans]
MLALDHIVIAGKNAEKDSVSFNKRLAIKAIKGGEHEHWGTYNYLAYFSNESYIEWLGIRDITIAKQSDNPLIQHLVFLHEKNQAGPFQFALRTDQMDDYITHFEENNIPYKGPFLGKRQQPDGTVLKWRMLFPTYDYQTGMLPFLIEWIHPSNGPSPISLTNSQAITNVSYSGVDKDAFSHIYQLKTKKSFSNQFSLQNTKIVFNNDEKLGFELI